MNWRDKDEVKVGWANPDAAWRDYVDAVAAADDADRARRDERRLVAELARRLGYGRRGIERGARKEE